MYWAGGGAEKVLARRAGGLRQDKEDFQQAGARPPVMGPIIALTGGVASSNPADAANTISEPASFVAIGMGILGLWCTRRRAVRSASSAAL